MRKDAATKDAAKNEGVSHAADTTVDSESLSDRIKGTANEVATVRGRSLKKGDIFKFIGLLIFFIIMGIIVVILRPYVADIFQEGGVERLVQYVQDAGPGGVLIVLGLQLLQIVVAFIPGEVVQFGAGLMYGPWLGALIILLGCVISSALIFKVVRTLGAPFVQDMVSTKHLEKFRAWDESGKLDAVVFILFLIPGMPKDLFTYLVPLTEMNMRTFLILTNTARIPGIFVSTFAASKLADGNITTAIVLVVVIDIVAGLVVLFREKLFQALGHTIKNDKHDDLK